MPDTTQTPFGDREAFHEAFEGLYPRLVGYARRFGAHYPEDIAQEAFVILLHRETPVEHPTAFLFGTVRTLALTERRPMKNRNISLEAVFEPSVAAAAEDELLGREVREKLQTLSPTFREALWLFAIEGLSISEVSEILKIPQATVKTRIHRAKAQLRAQLNPSGGVHVLA